MRKKIKIASVIILIALIFISLPNFFNLNNYKDEISKQIYKHTNYHLVIDGDIKLFFLPNLQLKLKNTKIFKQLNDKEALVKIAELQGSLKILPLLRKRIEIDKITIKQGVLNQPIDENKSIKINNIEVTTSIDNDKSNIKFAFDNNGLEVKGEANLKSLNELINQSKYENNFELKINGSKKVNNAATKSNIFESNINGKLKYNKSEPLNIEGKIKLNDTNLDIITAHNIYTMKENKEGFFKKIAYIKKEATHAGNNYYNLNFNGDIEAKNTIFNNLLIKNIDAKLNLSNDNLKTDINNISIYDGAISGIVNIKNFSSDKPYINADLKANGIEICNFFAGSKLLRSVKGKAEIALKLQTNSYNAKIAKANLNAEGHLEIKKGEIDNLAPEFSMLFMSLSGKEIKNLVFNNIFANFTIHNGILSNQDLKITSDIAELNGAGTLNLNNDTINYKLIPIKIFEQDNKDDISLKIKNTITEPKYSVDLNKMITNQVKERLFNKIDPSGQKMKNLENSIGKFLEMVK